mgnify:CR=1 FL=1
MQPKPPMHYSRPDLTNDTTDDITNYNIDNINKANEEDVALSTGFSRECTDKAKLCVSKYFSAWFQLHSNAKIPLPFV